MAEMRNTDTYRFQSENLKGRELRRPRCRWEENIEIDIKEKECEDADLMHAAQERDQ
jgi:hypothetical protein